MTVIRIDRARSIRQISGMNKIKIKKQLLTKRKKKRERKELEINLSGKINNKVIVLKAKRIQH